MSDEALRQAAREAAASLGEGARAQLLRQRLRSGELSAPQLRRAAALGYAPAAHALGIAAPEGDLAEHGEAFLATCHLTDSVRVALAAARAAAAVCEADDAGPVGRLLGALGELVGDIDLGESQDEVDASLEPLNPRTPLVMGQPSFPPDAPPGYWARQAAFEAGRATQHPQLFRVHAHCAVVFAARAVGEGGVRDALEAEFLPELTGG